MEPRLYNKNVCFCDTGLSIVSNKTTRSKNSYEHEVMWCHRPNNIYDFSIYNISNVHSAEYTEYLS